MPWYLDGRVKNNVTIVGGSVNITDPAFEPRFYTSKADISIGNPATESLFSFTGEGVLQELIVTFNKNGVDLLLDIDGGNILDIGLDDLGAQGEYDVGTLTQHGEIGLRLAAADQIIVDFSGVPAAFLTNFELRARGRVGGLTMNAIIVIYREKVT